jgi:hypothetical protein
MCAEWCEESWQTFVSTHKKDAVREFADSILVEAGRP